MKHGIDKVRGGSQSKPDLDPSEVKELSRRLWHAKGCCLRCGRQGHWATNCYAKTDVEGRPILKNEGDESTASSRKTLKDEAGNKNNKRKAAAMYIAVSPDSKGLRPKKQRGKTCGRCGRKGHAESQCYARTTVNGEAFRLDDDEKGIEDEDDASEESFDECARCGREGHDETQCHARTKVSGEALASDESENEGEESKEDEEEESEEDEDEESEEDEEGKEEEESDCEEEEEESDCEEQEESDCQEEDYQTQFSPFHNW